MARPPRPPIDLSALLVPDPARDEAHGLAAWASRVLDVSGPYLRDGHPTNDPAWWTAIQAATRQQLARIAV